jgi:NDP-sugar pyrophosphorylase family protein
VPLLNRPFLAYQLALLRRHGITDVVLACSYRVDDVRAAMGDGTAYGVRLRYAVETAPLGTGGGVRYAADAAQGTIVVLNGDVLTDADLSAMAAFHASHKSRTTIYLMRVADPRAFGLVETTADGRIRAFREKPTTPAEITTDTVNAGIYLIDAELLRRIAADTVVSIEREFFPALLRDGIAAYGWLTQAYWRDIGNPQSYREAQADLLAGRVATPLAPSGRRRGNIWIDDTVRVPDGLQFEGPAYVAPGAEIHAGARLGPNVVVGPRCSIGSNATLHGAVLWEDVRVERDAWLQDCVIGAGVRIGRGARIGPGVTLGSGERVPDDARLP